LNVNRPNQTHTKRPFTYFATSATLSQFCLVAKIDSVTVFGGVWFNICLFERTEIHITVSNVSPQLFFWLEVFAELLFFFDRKSFDEKYFFFFLQINLFFSCFLFNSQIIYDGRRCRHLNT